MRELLVVAGRTTAQPTATATAPSQYSGSLFSLADTGTALLSRWGNVAYVSLYTAARLTGTYLQRLHEVLLLPLRADRQIMFLHWRSDMGCYHMKCGWMCLKFNKRLVPEIVLGEQRIFARPQDMPDNIDHVISRMSWWAYGHCLSILRNYKLNYVSSTQSSMFKKLNQKSTSHKAHNSKVQAQQEEG